LVYSLIWLNLLMDDRHFDLQTKFIQKSTGSD
jgi:hypothetical protein